MSKEIIDVAIINNESEQHLTAKSGDRLKDVLEKSGFFCALPCDGMGRCGGCRVRYINGAPPAGSSDVRLIPQKDLEKGMRLLCRAVIYEDCRIILSDGDCLEDMQILTVDGEGVTTERNSFCDGSGKRYGIAVDLGTTTIAACVLERSGGYTRLKGSSSLVNRQRKYGFDVISRISAAEDEETARKMQRLVCEDIYSLVSELMESVTSREPGQTIPDTIAISGNTTMLHLLLGKSVKGLGRYPYTPVFLDLQHLDGSFIDSSLEGVDTDILPGISAFVGADIAAGLFFLKTKESLPFLMLDLGTNGEIAFFDGEKIRTASTAAGPVFEAGGISYGMASMAGAIDTVDIEKDSLSDTGFLVKYGTIGGESPKGICGTGVLELVSELLKNGVVDSTGLLSDAFFEEGFPVTEDGRIRLTQNDIRNLQLAKAAVASGIRTVLGTDRPVKIFVSGGFGNAINAEKIKKIRMLPEDFNGSIIAAGNTSLLGCTEYVRAMLEGETSLLAAREQLRAISENALVTELADTDGFDDHYIEAMNF